MSESLGSVLVIRIFLVFLVLYILFIAVTFNFLKAYKAKNYIVEYIEKKNGDYDTNEINDHLKSIGTLEKVPASNVNYCTDGSTETCIDADGGQNYPYRIFKTETSDADGTDICYFEVEVYTTLKIVPFLRLDKTMTIKGETKKVTNCG